MQQKKTIPLSHDRTLVLKYDSLEDQDEVDINRIVKIDFSNIPAELVTIPVLLAQFSIYLSELNEKVNLAKMNMEIAEAELSVEFREAHKEETGKDLSNEKTKDKIMTSAKYKLQRRLYFKAMKDQEIMNGVYWSLKSKDDKLSRLASSMNLGDAVETMLEFKLRRFNYVDMRLAKANNNI
jgi:hypothetical protein